MAYRGFKDLARRTASDEVLRSKAFNIAKNSKDNGYQKSLACMVYILFDTKLKAVMLIIQLKKIQQLAE